MSPRKSGLLKLALFTALAAAPGLAETYTLKLAGTTADTVVSMGHGQGRQWQVEDLKTPCTVRLESPRNFTFVLTRIGGSQPRAAIFQIADDAGKVAFPMVFALDPGNRERPVLTFPDAGERCKPFLEYLDRNKIELSFHSWDGQVALGSRAVEDKASAPADSEDVEIDLIH